jgi:superfamily I DNA/RNA helicase
MPKEKWLIDPGELDEFQRDIRGLSINDSYIVKGCAGSGKTILALYRANDIRIEALAEDESTIPSFTMVVYTKALRGFIRSGIIDLEIPIKQVIHYDVWDGSAVDYIVVDEAQDFTKEEMEVLVAAGKKSIMLYGDTQQQLYNYLKTGGVLSIEATATHLDIPQKELLKNYRLPKEIGAFASFLSIDKALEHKCVKTGGQKPRIIEFASWESELDFIIKEIRTRNYTDVAILLPFNIHKKATRNNGHRNVEDVKEYFDKLGFSHEFKMRDDGSDTIELDFDSELPKVITFHSSKGLQFETVFIPFCDYPNHDTWFGDRYQNPLYVAITRTYRNLYITHSNALSPFLNSIPKNKYD